jgi:hypothetical protein
MISRQSSTWQPSAFIRYSYVITFKLYTLHLVHKYTRHKLTNFMTSIIHYNVHTLALYSQNACTVLYCTVLYCSWCSVYLYNWYEAMWNTKVQSFSSHSGLPKHMQYNGTCGHTTVHKNSCPLRNETLVVQSTVRHLTNWGITSTHTTKTH